MIGYLPTQTRSPPATGTGLGAFGKILRDYAVMNMHLTLLTRVCRLALWIGHGSLTRQYRPRGSAFGACTGADGR